MSEIHFVHARARVTIVLELDSGRMWNGSHQVAVVRDQAIEAATLRVKTLIDEANLHVDDEIKIIGQPQVVITLLTPVAG